MPKISTTRQEEREQLKPLLDVLNEKFSYLRILERLRWQGEEPGEEQEYWAIYAEHQLRSQLRKLLKKLPKKPLSPDEVRKYVARRETINKEVNRIAKRLGIPDLGRSVAGIEFRLPSAYHRIFMAMFEEAAEEWPYPLLLVIDWDPRLAADAEALRLFLMALYSPVVDRLKPCEKEGCGKYFIDLMGKQRGCSPRCTRSLLNKVHNPKHRKDRADLKKEKRKTKLKAARKALKQWKTAKEAAKHTDIKKNFFTLNWKLLTE